MVEQSVYLVGILYCSSVSMLAELSNQVTTQVSSDLDILVH